MEAKSTHTNKNLSPSSVLPLRKEAYKFKIKQITKENKPQISFKVAAMHMALSVKAKPAHKQIKTSHFLSLAEFMAK